MVNVFAVPGRFMLLLCAYTATHAAFPSHKGRGTLANPTNLVVILPNVADACITNSE